MTENHRNHFNRFEYETILRLNEILSKLEALTEKVNQMGFNVEELTAEVARIETVDASAVHLLTVLVDELEKIKFDPVAVQGLIDRVKTATDGLAAAIAAVPGEVVPPTV